MSDIINTKTVDVVETTANATKYTLDYVLEQIEKLQTDTEYIKSAVNGLGQNIQDPSGSRAEALGGAIKSRETTNQRLISFYEKMYDDLKPKNPDPVNEAMKRIVAEFISQKTDYVADKSHKINAEEFEAILNEIQQVSYLVK